MQLAFLELSFASSRQRFTCRSRKGTADFDGHWRLVCFHSVILEEESLCLCHLQTDESRRWLIRAMLPCDLGRKSIQKSMLRQDIDAAMQLHHI